MMFEDTSIDYPEESFQVYIELIFFPAGKWRRQRWTSARQPTKTVIMPTISNQSDELPLSVGFHIASISGYVKI